VVGVLRNAGRAAKAARYDDTLPPGVAELRAEGFVPVEEITGWDGLAMVWPEQHRRAVPETREHMEASTCWLVRPPSSGLEAIDYLAAIHRAEERDPPADQRVDFDDYELRLRQAAQEVFDLPPEVVKHLAHGDPEADGAD
jgi:hypothetical protein